MRREKLIQSLRNAAKVHEQFAELVTEKASRDINIPPNSNVFHALQETGKAQIRMAKEGTLGLGLHNMLMAQGLRMLSGESFDDIIID